MVILRSVLLVLWSVSCLSESAFAQRGFNPVHLVAEDGSTGNGVQFRVASGCTIITADHVVRNSENAIVTPAANGANRVSIGPRNGNLDIALLSQPIQENDGCPTLPNPSDISRAINNNQTGTVVYIENDGSRSNIPVYLTYYNLEWIEVVIDAPTHATKPMSFREGMSGSVLVVAGTPVATLQKVATDGSGVATATRLDETMRRFDNQLPMPPSRPTTTDVPRHEPYDVDVLPGKFQKIVRDARAAKEMAINACDRGNKAKTTAEDAAALARREPLGVNSNGYARYRSTKGDFYEGQVKIVGTRISAHGFGITIKGEGEFAGNEFYCEAVRPKGCEGPGVLIFKYNDANTNGNDLWCGNFVSGAAAGLGYLAKEDSARSEWWFRVNSEEASPGVMNERTGDKRRFEGHIDRNWNGEGVLWNKDGQVQALGEWNGGDLVRDDTDAWRAGTLK